MLSVSVKIFLCITDMLNISAECNIFHCVRDPVHGENDPRFRSAVGIVTVIVDVSLYDSYFFSI